MKLLFIFEHNFIRENGLVYNTDNAAPNTLWLNNYLPYFDAMTVIGKNKGQGKNKKVLSSVENKVDFTIISEYTSVLNFFTSFFTIKRKIQKEIEQAQLTLVRLPCILGFTAIPILIKNKRPFFIEIVSNTYEAYRYHGSFVGKICASFFDKLTKKDVKKASHVVYVAEKLHKDYPTEAQAEIISNVMIPRILPKENVQIARFQSNVFKIGLIGSFQVKYKGQDILLRAVSLLEDNIKENIELYFIGIGDFDWVIDIAKKLDLDKHIQFIGSIAHGEAIFNLLETLTLYVQPSFQEGLPRAMLEAMSMACPVLGSTVGGIPENLKPDFLHTPGDYNKLSQQIKIFYDNRDLLYKEAISNLETVVPFLKENLDKKRKYFYTKIKNDLKSN